MIPQEKSAAVTRALQEAFEVTEFEDIRVIKDLAKSMVFRIVVRGTAYLLKISMRTNDPARHYFCMKTAAEAGLAPRVRYASVPDQVSIEDFIETVPFPREEALIGLPTVLRALHALPAFPRAPGHLNTTCTFLLNKGPAVDGFLQQVQAANILPKSEGEEFFARFGQLAEAYSLHDSDMVSSHNDLFKPDNILFDGRRVWLIDWEAAFLNDRYADLAVAANLIVGNDAEENSFLHQYFGQAPDEYQRARFFLAQQLAHMFYGLAFLMMGSAGNSIDWSEAIPEFKEFYRQLWRREVELTDKHTKLVFGRIHWQRLLENLHGRRFDEALRIVAGGRAARVNS